MTTMKTGGWVEYKSWAQGPSSEVKMQSSLLLQDQHSVAAVTFIYLPPPVSCFRIFRFYSARQVSRWSPSPRNWHTLCSLIKIRILKEGSPYLLVAGPDKNKISMRHLHQNPIVLQFRDMWYLCISHIPLSHKATLPWRWDFPAVLIKIPTSWFL